jgi:signal transduction histidine kinase
MLADPAPILVVDDHLPNAMAIEAVLEPTGCRIDVASSGKHALERLAQSEYALILMDVHMPGLDGFQTVARIRENPEWVDVPVVFLTAVFDDPVHVRRGFALGAVDFIAKPFDPEVLRAKVRAFMAMYLRGERAERERRVQRERVKDIFLGGVGHDLRGPLNTILLGADLVLAKMTAGVPVSADSVRKIRSAARRMQGIVEDVLDLTRVEFVGAMTIAPRAANLGDICRAIVDEVRTAHPTCPLALTTRGDLSGVWDPDRLGRVVSNLVANAVHHGGDHPVAVDVAREDDRVTLKVHNGGKPIEPARLPQLFEPFQRGDTTAQGLGLGLFLVREIVSAHGGRITVESREGEGTTFAVALPRHASAA